MIKKSHGIPVIDLFAGAGGLSVGAHLAGGRVAACVEIDTLACETLRANPRYHGSVVPADVSTLSGKDLRRLAHVSAREPLLIVGGPPCQPFSKAAYWTEAGDDAAYRRARARGIRRKKPEPPKTIRPDERRDLVKEFMRLVIESKADGFLFENVPSIKHPRNRPLFEWVLRTASDAGYVVAHGVVNAAEYGVAQLRQRVVIIGSRHRCPALPRPTHGVAGNPGRPLSPLVTAGEVLEEFSSAQYFEPEEVVHGRWAEHLREVPPGWNYKAHTAWAGHPRPTFETETRFWSFLLKLTKERPSWTIAATPGPWTGPFHWDSRRLRTPELAALQGFPRRYVVRGARRDRVKQLGNAVPVPLAKALMRSLLKAAECRN